MIKVKCPDCNEWIDEQTVEVLGCEEDFMGRDKLHFVCPTCETEQTSLRIGKR